MKKESIGIIGGKGKMGNYFANFFKRNGHDVIVSDVGTPLSNKALARKADVVIVSVPIRRTQEVISEIAPHIKKSGLLMDLTSVKGPAMKAMKKCKGSYLGCHPLFGPTANIHGQIVIISPGKGKLWQLWFRKILEKNGAIVRELTAEKHDQLMAYIQTLTHFSHIAFSDALRKSGISIKEFIKYPSPVYMLELYMMGRILNQDPKLYASIQLTNPMNIKAIESYLRSCRQLAETIEKHKHKDNVKFFQANTDYLGHFAKIAMEESDQLLRHVKLPQKSRLFKANDKSPKLSDMAILGPQNTYSHLALQRFNPKAHPWYALSITEVIELVAGKKVKAGLIPLENTTGGSVRESLDELYVNNVHVEQVVELPIKLALVSTIKVPLKKIKTIYSHSQALLQSRQFLKKHCPKATLLPFSSTTAAIARMLSESKEGTVAIASLEAAAAEHLKILKENIQDDKNNTTYFALIGRGDAPKAKRSAKKTSIAFHFKKDSPGSLNSILQTFSDAKINLTKIESRPSSKVRGEFVFYLDFEGSSALKKNQDILKDIQSKVANLKILGSY